MNRSLLLLIVSIFPGSCMQSASLVKAPSRVDTAHEIATTYNNSMVEHFNELTPQERIFIYYMFRASLAGNAIAADQSHRDVPKILQLLDFVFERKDELKEKSVSFDTDTFSENVELYLIYLWTNHCQYFIREHFNEKRTPERLKLSALTKENLITALTVLGYQDAQKEVEAIAPSLFDSSTEPTQTVPGNIEKSGINFYSSDFTEDDFKKIDPKIQSTLNAYFYVQDVDGVRVPKYQLYSVHGKYSKELSVIVHWLQKAYDLVIKNPEQFDTHFATSLEYLIKYFETGDEELFKKHCIEWLKTNSRIDYCFGFIETYQDPKSYRAIFQSDVTIKSLDIDKLNALLPELEKRLPISEKFKRSTLDEDEGAMPNASINVKAFSAGTLGPLNITLAYCLPNYDEIRSDYGSKQIIYHPEKTIYELINPKLGKRLFNSTAMYEWSEKHDPDGQLMRDIFMLEVILHETLGHGSGKLTTHTFKEGEDLTIDTKQYKVGDTIPVTSANLAHFLEGYDHAIEELRAEIIALLSSIVCFDEFAKIGMLKDWPEKVGKEKIIDLSIISMARTGLRRLMQQAEDATEIAGDHARANTTILHFLINREAVTIKEEQIEIDGAEYTVLDIELLDRAKAIEAIKELAQMVQEIKSTGDGQKAKWLIDTLGTPIHKEHLKIMKKNMNAACGDVRVTAMIYPLYTPIMGSDDTITDIKAEWPEDITQEYQRYNAIALSQDN